MPGHERLSGSIALIDLSFVERRRTPEWAIQVGIRCHLAGLSLRDASQHLETVGVDRSHVAIHDWVRKAALQLISTVTADRITVDERMNRVNGDEYWLYGAIDPETNEIIHVNLYPSTARQTTRWFRDEFHRQCWLDDVFFLVDEANYLRTVLAEDGYRFQVMSNGNRNAIERVFCEIERRTSSFANSFSMSKPRQLSRGSMRSPSPTMHAKINATAGRLLRSVAVVVPRPSA